MKQVVKMLAAMLLIAICLTSDTASSASQFQVSRFKVQESEPRSSMNSAACVGTQSDTYRRGRKRPSVLTFGSDEKIFFDVSNS